MKSIINKTTLLGKIDPEEDGALLDMFAQNFITKKKGRFAQKMQDDLIGYVLQDGSLTDEAREIVADYINNVRDVQEAYTRFIYLLSLQRLKYGKC
jgi:hypothetical protein